MFEHHAEPPLPPVADSPAGRIWVDILDPSPNQCDAAGQEIGVRIPTREDLSEIESSSRHYVEGEALYLSTVLLAGGEGDDPRLTPVGFVITPKRLVTVRFDPLRAFDLAAEQMRGHPPASPFDAFTTLIEAVVDRKADVLETAGAKLEVVSQSVFHRAAPKPRNKAGAELRKALEEVGRIGDRVSKMRASLLTTGRILAYVADGCGREAPRELQSRVAAAREDIVSLTAYSETLAGKVAFLLDAVLGFINIDQNDVIKVLTVVSVVGVPPTLVASMYGMNFKIMPELNWHYGYPYALGLIFLSAVLPLALFKLRGWF